MASLLYDSIDFATTLGGLPRISREITREVDAQSGKVTQERHVISAEWHAIPGAGTIAQQQAAITVFEAAIEALAGDGELIFKDNSGAVCWAYNSPTSANDHDCPLGIEITRISFPWGPAKHVTNDPVRITWEAVVQPCSGDPIAGIGSLIYTVAEEWDTSGLVTVTYQGTLCVCFGFSAKTLLATVLATTFLPDASDRFTAQGSVLGAGFGPSAASFTELDQEDRCRAFRFVFGGGSVPNGLAARSLELDVGVSIIQNLVTLDVAASYGYRGKHTGTGSTTGLLFGAPLGGSTLIFTGGISPGSFGLSGAGVTSDWQAVYREAWNLAGIDLRPFLPPGAGSIFLKTEPQVSTNTASNTITSRAKFYAPWIWDAEILLYDVTVSVEIPRPGFGSRRLMHGLPGTTPPRPYCNTSGYDVMSVQFHATIVSRTQYYEIPLQLTEDALNVWFIGHSLSGVSKLPNQTQQATVIKEGYVTSQVTQMWAVRDPSLDPTLKAIPVGSIQRIKTAANLKPVLIGIGEGGLS